MKDFIVVYFRFYSLHDFTSQYSEFIFTLISPRTLIVDIVGYSLRLDQQQDGLLIVNGKASSHHL